MVKFCQTPTQLGTQLNELELVKVGVDFVFQCHKKKKNKNNPHLILIYRKALQVYNFGRVTLVVSRSCLEGVFKGS